MYILAAEAFSVFGLRPRMGRMGLDMGGVLRRRRYE
jgi:hypothetical protein